MVSTGGDSFFLLAEEVDLVLCMGDAFGVSLFGELIVFTGEGFGVLSLFAGE